MWKHKGITASDRIAKQFNLHTVQKKSVTVKKKTNNVNNLIQQMAMVVTLTARMAPNSLDSVKKKREREGDR